MEGDAAQLDTDTVVGKDDPGKCSTEERPHHPEDGLDTKVGTTVLVADELGAIGEDDWERATDTEGGVCTGEEECVCVCVIKFGSGLRTRLL